MANLKRFMWEGSHDGMKFDIYPNFPRVIVGHGEINIITPLHVKMTGKIPVFPAGTIEVVMPDESPSGVCVVSLNGDRANNVPYRTSGNALIIDHPGSQIKIDTERKFTWIEISRLGLKFGIWPQGQKMEEA